MSTTLPNGLPTQEPALCSPMSAVADTPEDALRVLGREPHWVYQVKYDGIRALIYVIDGEVKIRNRRGSDITYRYPELADGLADLPDVVLDGEVVIFDERGLPDFAAMHWRDAQGKVSVSRAMASIRPVTFVAFDVLWREGEDLRSRALSLRLGALRDLTGLRLQQAVVSGNGEVLWSSVVELGLEGIVAKDLRSRYAAGRHRSWVKIKATKRATVFALGYIPGEGAREGSVGAVSMGVWADEPGGEVRYVGKVGSGFTERDLAHLTPLLQTGQVVLFEVEYLGVTEQGQLRQPVFKGVRGDITITEATARQLR